MKTIILILLCVLLILLSGVWLFSSKREHLLSSLLSLEYMVIGLFLMFFYLLSSGWLFYCLIYITFTACEGALGLSLLVMCTRTHGGDYFKSFNLMN